MLEQNRGEINNELCRNTSNLTQTEDAHKKNTTQTIEKMCKMNSTKTTGSESMCSVMLILFSRHNNGIMILTFKNVHFAIFIITVTNRGNMEKGKKKMDSYWSKKEKSNDPIKNKVVGVCLLVRISTQLRTLT